jgi:ElaB/YqjD/DUF883 family membrane-anchored ribosome-binding protein
MDVAESTSEAVKETVTKDKLMDDLRVVISDAEELLKATANQTGERVAAARAKAGESLKAAKARLNEAEESVMEKARAGAKAADEFVHANPWKTAGVAGAIGLLLGALISRR